MNFWISLLTILSSVDKDTAGRQHKDGIFTGNSSFQKFLFEFLRWIKFPVMKNILSNKLVLLYNYKEDSEHIFFMVHAEKGSGFRVTIPFLGVAADSSVREQASD
ncbi:hypothetical protein NPIL_30391 [Nephila pilipes]|uniref:Uncharacterized protein n=1 Tax=Nephila pilipes TaxID=299642 RepID=A0A8X6N4D6_NEPPI|nr:hypothetical protein NPIL_30391 [Nephila pilipes]